MSESDANILERVNRIFTEKNKVFEKRELQLKTYHEELKQLEQELLEKANSLQKERDHLEQEKKQLEERWKEIKDYEENAKKGMDEILTQLKLQEQENDLLEKKRKEESEEILQGKARLGILEPSFVPETENTSAKSKRKEEVKQESGNNQQKSSGDPSVDAVEVTQNVKILLDSVKKHFPNAFVEEQKEDFLCVSVGNKELRFFFKEPVNEAQIYAIRKGGGTDRELQQQIAKANQIQQEWEFSCKDNHLTSTMPFTNETDFEIVAKKCAECINKYIL